MLTENDDRKPIPTAFRETIKKEVVANRCVVATNHPLASAAGIETFARGGNAFDAAAAALFALSVVEPMMVGIFGAGHMIIRSGKTGKIEALDNYAVAPKAAVEDMYKLVEERRPGQSLFETIDHKNTVGHLSVATPGTLKAWQYLVERYGTQDLSSVIEPAIRYARNGFRASPYLVHMIGISQSDIQLYPETAKVFLPQGKLPPPGDLILRTDYARTLTKIANEGSNILYHGELAKAVVDDMNENKGILNYDDLAEYKLIQRRPIHGKYRDEYEVYSTPPSSSGGTHIIQILNILERFNIGSFGFGSAEYLHLFAEALKIAFADRQHYMGDPDRTMIPLAGLISKRYAKDRGSQIRLDSARRYAPGNPLSMKVRRRIRLTYRQWTLKETL